MIAQTFPTEPAYVLRNATVARALLAQPQSYPGEGETVRLDLAVERGRLARIRPAGAGEVGPSVDLDGGMVWPCFTDIHTHLDKGQIWPRSPNPDGRHASARTVAAADRTAYWSAADVAARLRFGLRCAYAHGTRAVRTHLDSYGGQDEISWPVLAAMRAEWAGRVALQGVSLIAIGRSATRPLARASPTSWLGITASSALPRLVDVKIEIETARLRERKHAVEEDVEVRLNGDQ